MILQPVISLILASSGVTTIVGDKVFPVVATERVKKPYVTVRRTGASSQIVKGQPGEDDRNSFAVAAYSEDYAEALDILSAIRTTIDDHTGSSTGVNFDRIWYVGSQDLFDKDDNSYVIVDTYEGKYAR